MLGNFIGHYDVTNSSGNSNVGEKIKLINNLAQLIAEPTLVTSHSSTILDLAITNCSERFCNSGTLKCL